MQVALPHANIVRDTLLSAIGPGLEEHDWSAICEIARRQAALAEEGSEGKETA